MAGFDKVDPANPCLIAVLPNCTHGRERTRQRVSNPIEICKCLSWTRKLYTGQRTSRVGDPEWRAICVH